MTTGQFGRLSLNNFGLGGALRKAAIAGTFNLKKSTLSNFRTAYIAQAGNIPVAFHGDSTIRGVDETSSPYNAQYNTHSIASQLAALLQASSVNAGANNIFGEVGTLADLNLRDVRFSFTGATTPSGVICAGGNGINMPTAAGTMVFTPTGNVTKFDIWTYDDAGTRTVSWSVDGGGATNITTTGVSQAKKTTVSAGTSGAHTLTLTWVAGSVIILAVSAYDDTASRKEITFYNWGIPGATSANCISNANTPQGGRVQALTNYAPKLCFSECGVINDWRNSVSVATSKANVTTWVQACQAANCDVILLVPPYDNGVLGLTSTQNDYVTAMYQVAVEQNCGLFDIRKKWLSYSNAVANGWQAVTDTIHLTQAGNADMAAMLKPVVLYATAA